METYVILDIETTGVYIEAWDEVVEVAAIKVSFDGPNLIFHEYLKPHKKVPRKVEQLTGIKNEFLNDKPTKNTILPKLREFIGDSIVVAHNASFDVTFLNFWFLTYNLPLITRRICTMKNFKRCTGEKVANLTAACKFFNIDIVQAHSALHDTNATEKLFSKLLSDYELVVEEKNDIETYKELMTRIAKSNAHAGVRNIICDAFMPPKNRETFDLTKQEVIDCYEKGETPHDVFIKSKYEYKDLLNIFYVWVNRLNASRFLKHISDASTYRFTQRMVSRANTMKDLIELHKEIYDTENINLFYYTLVYCLEKNHEKMKYKPSDFDYFFGQETPIEVIAKKIKRSEDFVIDMFVEWSFANREKKDIIKSYIVSSSKLKEILISGPKNTNELITKKLYDKKFFNL